MDAARLGPLVVATDGLPVEAVVDEVLETTRWAIDGNPTT